MHLRRLAVLCLSFAAALTHAQSYTSIVIFGDSLSDTGNIAHLVQAQTGIRYPGPLADYTDGRFTNGTDTLPAARNFTGVWVEQFAATLAAHPAISASLDGGTDYAFGSATTNNGTHQESDTVGGITLTITVPDMGSQVDTYLAAHPTVPANTLVVLWGGANDLAALATAGTQNPQTVITTAASQEVALAQRLIAAGATDLLIPNLPPLGAIPRFAAEPTSVQSLITQAASAFNTALTAGLQALPAANPGRTLHINQLDTFTLFQNVIAAPSAAGLTNVAASAQAQLVNPDQYLFWDDLHPTTAGHHLLATTAAGQLAPAIATTTTLTSSTPNAAVGSPVTFTAPVVAASGSPIGNVTFSDGSTALGTTALTSIGTTTSTATYTTSTLAAGTHSITASFAGSPGFSPSASAALTETIATPALAATLSPASLTLARGASGTTTLTLTPSNGFSGTATAACGALSAHLACSFSNTSFTFTSDTAGAQTATITIATNATARLRSPAGLRPRQPTGPTTPEIVLATLSAMLLPSLGIGFLRRRASLQHLATLRLLRVMVAAVLLAGVATLSGCGSSSSNDATSGTYMIPITVTANSTTTTQTLSVTVQ